MTKRQNRMLIVAFILLGASLATYFIIKAFNANLMYFFTPSDVIENIAPIDKNFKIGGMVTDGSVKRDGVKVSFVISDNKNNIKISYVGILPDLFREGQGIVATGYLDDGLFIADTVLAKHDENYMPPELAKALNNN